MYIFEYVCICINCIYAVLSYVGGNKECNIMSKQQYKLHFSELENKSAHSNTIQKHEGLFHCLNVWFIN